MFDATIHSSPQLRAVHASASPALASASSADAASATDFRSLVAVTTAPPLRTTVRPVSPRTRGGNPGTARHRAAPPAAAGPPRRSRDNTPRPPVHSSQLRIVGPRYPLGEAFSVTATGHVVAHQPFHVFGQLNAGDLVPTQFPAETGVEAEPATKMNLESLDLFAGRVRDDLALQADVRGLDA